MKRIIVALLGCVGGLLLSTYLLEGVRQETLEGTLLVGAILGAVYVVIRPLLRLLILPLGVVTFGILYVLLDAGLLYLVAGAFQGVQVAGFLWALGASLIVNLICALLRPIIK